MDWSRCPDVERTPGKVWGEWCVKGTRLPVQAIIDIADARCTAEKIATEIYEGVPVEVVKDFTIRLHRAVAGDVRRVARLAGFPQATTPVRPAGAPACRDPRGLATDTEAMTDKARLRADRERNRKPSLE
jgi:uncharacterized protein (DUF433 family)